MSNDNMFRGHSDDPRDYRLAIPDKPVQKFRELTGCQYHDHAVRSMFKTQFNTNFLDNECLSQAWGHSGFAVPLDYTDVQGSTMLWMIFNPDKTGREHFVLVTVYSNDQFESRMGGGWVSTSRPTPRAQPDHPQLQFKVECRGEESQEFTSDEACVAYLEVLAKKGYTEKDWHVWKKVRTTLALED